MDFIEESRLAELTTILTAEQKYKDIARHYLFLEVAKPEPETERLFLLTKQLETHQKTVKKVERELDAFLNKGKKGVDTKAHLN